MPLSVDDKVDPVAAGGSETVETRTGLPALPVEATINKLVVTTPIPAQIASVDAVTFSGGNMKSSSSVVGTNLVVTFTGPVSSKDIQVPTVTARQTVKSGIGGTTISWKTFSKVDADTSYGMATCTPNNPSQVVNTTTVTGSSTATTTAPTGPAPTTTPASNAPGRGDSTVSVSGSATIGVSPPAPTAPPLPTLPTPPVPATPTLPVPVPGGGGVPGSPSLPRAGAGRPDAPGPGRPPQADRAAQGVPGGPAPAAPRPAAAALRPPVPTPAPPSVPSVPTVPKLPTGVGVSVGVTANLRGLS